MATINDPSTSTNVQRVGGVATGDGAAHVVVKPLPFNAIGHYQTNHRTVLVATQAANSRLFEVRHTVGTSLHVPLRLLVRWFQNAAHTAAIEDSIDVFKVTGFTAVDNTNVVTPTASVKRTTGMTAAPANAQIRGVTVAGAAAGMTGGTLTKDGNSIGQLPKWLTTAFADPVRLDPTTLSMFDNMPNGAHPYTFAQNEGFIVENRVLLGAAAGSSVYIDYEYAEVSNY